MTKVLDIISSPRGAIKNSDTAIAKLQEADLIVISVPMYNFSITSGLKAYFDHIARARVTFRYTENGSEGLLKRERQFPEYRKPHWIRKLKASLFNILLTEDAYVVYCHCK